MSYIDDRIAQIERSLKYVKLNEDLISFERKMYLETCLITLRTLKAYHLPFLPFHKDDI